MSLMIIFLIVLMSLSKPSKLVAEFLPCSNVPKKSLPFQKNKLEKKVVPLIKEETPPNISVTANIVEAMTAKKQIKEALGFHCRVAFNEAGESQVTFNLKNKKDLNTLIDMVTPNLFI